MNLACANPIVWRMAALARAGQFLVNAATFAREFLAIWTSGKSMFVVRLEDNAIVGATNRNGWKRITVERAAYRWTMTEGRRVLSPCIPADYLRIAGLPGPLPRNAPPVLLCLVANRQLGHVRLGIEQHSDTNGAQFPVHISVVQTRPGVHGRMVQKLDRTAFQPASR